MQLSILKKEFQSLKEMDTRLLKIEFQSWKKEQKIFRLKRTLKRNLNSISNKRLPKIIKLSLKNMRQSFRIMKLR